MTLSGIEDYDEISVSAGEAREMPQSIIRRSLAVNSKKFKYREGIFNQY
jgi:hypothetical protein